MWPERPAWRLRPARAAYAPMVSLAWKAQVWARHAHRLSRAPRTSAAAGGQTAPSSAPVLLPGARLRSQGAEYEVGDRIGASTFTGVVTDTSAEQPSVAVGNEVVLKATSLRMLGWRALDTWEASVGALTSLSHPSLPALVDSFQEDSAEDCLYILVRRLAPGRPLTALLLEERWRPDEAAVTSICDSLLSALVHAHGLRPPVALGGVSPARVLLLRGDAPTVSLVGYGDALSEQAAALGYAPPEASSRGVCTPAGDLYAVGATALFLLSGMHPGALPLRGVTPDWSKVTVTSPALRALLSRLLQAEPEARGDAAGALALLRGTVTQRARSTRDAAAAPAGALSPYVTPSAPSTLTRTSFNGSPRVFVNATPLELSIIELKKREQWGELITSKIRMQRDAESSIEFVIPPLALSSDEAMRSAFGRGAFTIAWLVLVGQWTAAAVAARASAMSTLFSTPFWAAGGKMVADLGAQLSNRTTVRITPTRWSIVTTALGRKGAVREVGGPTSQAAGFRPRPRTAEETSAGEVGQAIELLVRRDDGAPGYASQLVVDRGLRPVEVAWICRELNQYLADVGATCGYEPIERRVGGDEVFH